MFMQFKAFNEEVLYCEDAIVKVSPQDIERLKGEALNNKRKRVRICAHRNVEDNPHEMLIIHTKGAYIPPHKHLNKSESFHVIEGVVDVIIFDEEGGIADVIEMGDYASGKPFYYRISDPIYHSLMIHSNFLVFHETTKGPFNKEDTIFPSWAPGENAEHEVYPYMRDLSCSVETFKS